MGKCSRGFRRLRVRLIIGLREGGKEKFLVRIKVCFYKVVVL